MWTSLQMNIFLIQVDCWPHFTEHNSYVYIYVPSLYWTNLSYKLFAGLTLLNITRMFICVDPALMNIPLPLTHLVCRPHFIENASYIYIYVGLILLNIPRIHIYVGLTLLCVYIYIYTHIYVGLTLLNRPHNTWHDSLTTSEMTK